MSICNFKLLLFWFLSCKKTQTKTKNNNNKMRAADKIYNALFSTNKTIFKGRGDSVKKSLTGHFIPMSFRTILVISYTLFGHFTQ